ncbi:ankyrin-1 [Dichotomopilus funicola]|uniref:Ankyrin-1 n=1 Tax=Dichotomopilus funicola TaxID=1934379 RepID=A0AAN6V341_9PEZI|nr:ankyrin-1 [Dichotomopilus funicola]
MDDSAAPIMVEASKNRRHLRDLISEITTKVDLGKISTEVEADPKYLTGSLGVFQKGEASLDARLSNHYLAREVIRLLKQLDVFTSDLRDIIDGKRPQSTWTRGSLQMLRGEFGDDDLWSDDEDSEGGILKPETGQSDERGGEDLTETLTESRDLCLSINESVTSLLRLSIQIHQSSRCNKFQKSSRATRYDVSNDINHVKDFFPHLDITHNTALATRLGKANAQRRHYLAGNRRATGADDETESIALFSADLQPSESNLAPSVMSGTRASTFRSRITAENVVTPSVGPANTLFGRSSGATVEEQKLRHVHADLSSYTCLDGGCDEMFFESRTKWWAHEMQAHRKSWACGICTSALPSLAAMKDHLRTDHRDQVDEALLVLPNSDLIEEDDGKSIGGDREAESDSDEDDNQLIQEVSEPDLIQKLCELAEIQRPVDPSKLPVSPDLAMRTEAVRNGANPETLQLRNMAQGHGESEDQAPLLHDPETLAAELQRQPERLQNASFITRQLAYLVRHDMVTTAEYLSQQLIDATSKQQLITLMNTRLDSGSTLLMVSASQGLERVVDLLLDSGADPNLVGGVDDGTALDKATDAGYFTIAEKLLAKGADPSISQVFKKVISNEREYAGENLGVTIGEPGASGSSPRINASNLGPLGRAAFDGDVESVGRLLGDGSGPSLCDIEEGAGSGSSPLLLASSQSHFDVMDLLLDRGANINTTSKHGWTPLMLASKRMDMAAVKYLIEHGADVNHLSPDRWTALAEAANNGSKIIMQLLLEAGADPEIRAQSDWALLMHAAYGGDLEAVNLLLDAGASFEEISARDASVMLLASAAGAPKVVRHLLDAGCSPDSNWSKAPEQEASFESPGADESAASLKLQERIERVYKVGWTPLMVACQIEVLFVEMLLYAGANTEPRSPMFKTALEIARENGRSEVAEVLENWLTKGSVAVS